MVGLIYRALYVGLHRAGAYPLFQWATTRWGHGRVVRIPHGPLRGYRWERDHRTSYWFHRGRYEPAMTAAFASLLRPGDHVWDLGANAGYYTLIAASRVGPTGSVLAVDAIRDMCDLVARQLAHNDRAGLVLHAAVTTVSGEIGFTVAAQNARSRIDAAAETRVPALTLGDLRARVGHEPTVIKMDLEGAERDLVCAVQAFPTVRVWCVEVHGGCFPLWADALTAAGCTRVAPFEGHAILAVRQS